MSFSPSNDPSAAAGPYRPLVRAGDLLFVSGQGPIDPATGEFVLGSIAEQTRLVLENLRAALALEGASLRHVVRCGVFLADENDFAAMNEEYRKFFPDAPPARTTVAVRMVKAGMKVEIDCIASLAASR